MKERKKIKTSYKIIIIICNVIIILLLVKYNYDRGTFSSLFAKEQEFLKLHETLPDFAAKDIYHRDITSNELIKNIQLYIFLDPLLKSSYVKYIDNLFKKFKNNDFIAIGIVTKNWGRKSRKFIKEENIIIPIVNDNKSKLRNSLKIGKNRDALIIAGRDNKVLYASKIIPEYDTLRQLVEKYVVGEITYHFIADQSENLLRNIDPYSIILYHIKNEKYVNIIDVLNNNPIVVYFGANCTSCQLKNYTEHLREFNKALNKKRNLIIIFSPYFTREEINFYIPDRDIKPKIYISTEQMVGIDDKPRVLVFDEMAQIKEVEYLSPETIGREY